MFSYDEINEEWSEYYLENLLALGISFNDISCSPNITWKTIQKHSDKPWDWDYGELSRNPNITWEIIQANPNKYWHSYFLSSNPNITFEIIRNNPQVNWDHYNLSSNKFTLEKEMFFRKKLREWFKKSDLKRELIANLWHPKNYEKFKYYDPEMFSNEEGDE